MRILTLSIAILLCGMSTVRAQRQDLELIRGNDTLAYTYVPFDPSEMERSAAPSESAAVKRGFFHRIIDYFDRANEDRTFEKKIDFSIIGGPSYSSTTKLGLGLMAVGLYRTDRTDSLTPLRTYRFSPPVRSRGSTPWVFAATRSSVTISTG